MSSETKTHEGRLGPRGWMLVCLGIALFIGANAHLVYVAFASRPECVAHLKLPDESGERSALRAARSSC